MGSGEDTTAPAKPPTTSTAGAPPQAAAQEAPPAHLFPEWANSFQAFYGPGAAAAAAAATPQAFFSSPVASSPYPWGSQVGDRPLLPPYMMAPYGTPIAYPPMYAHGAVFAHPSLAAGSVYIAAEAERREEEAKKSDGGKATSGSANEDASQSDCESEGSSEIREESTDRQSKKTFSGTFGDGEITQHATQYTSTTAESSHSGRGPPAAKLPISAPGRAVLHNPGADLNIPMDAWNAPHASMKARSNGANAIPAMAASSMAGPEGLMPGHHWMHDERELKRQRRKQSNRESARRSRLRKQQECEDLAKRVDELNNENSVLRSELDQLNKEYGELESENASIEEELTRLYGPGILSALEGNNIESSSISSIDGEGSGCVRQTSTKPSQANGNFLSSNGKA